MKKLFVLLVSVNLLFQCSSPERPVYKPFDYSSFPFYGQTMGDYPVGFRSTVYRDVSRTFGGQSTRPVLVGLWYPAQVSESDQLTYGDYVFANVQRTGKDLADTSMVDVKAAFNGLLGQFFNVEEAKADSLFDMPVRVFDAPQVREGRFPLIVYAASFNAGIHENSALWEQLASYGYVIATVASIGHDSPGMTPDSLGIYAQNADLRFAYEQVINEPFINPAQVVTSGFSWGAFSAILTGIEKDVDVIITLDGSNNYFPEMNQAYSNTYSKGFDGAYAQFNQRRVPTARRAFDSTVFDLMKAQTNSYLFMFRKMDHRDFASTFQFFNWITGDSVFVALQERVYGSANSRMDKSEGYEQVGIMVKDLLDAYVKEDEEARLRIDQVEGESFQLNRKVIVR